VLRGTKYEEERIVGGQLSRSRCRIAPKKGNEVA